MAISSRLDEARSGLDEAWLGTRTASCVGSTEAKMEARRFEQAQHLTSIFASYFIKLRFMKCGFAVANALQKPPPSQATLKSRAICRLTRPPLLVAYRRTAPPALRAQAPTSGPIRRVSFPRLVRSTEVSLPPGTEIRNCIPLIKFPVPAASQTVAALRQL